LRDKERSRPMLLTPEQVDSLLVGESRATRKSESCAIHSFDHQTRHFTEIAKMTFNAFKQAGPKIILLLTATIDPRSTIFVLRSDPNVRMIDYRIAIRRWLTEPDINKVIFCENSGTDLDQLRFAAANDNAHNHEIVFVSYSTPEADGKRGKGYGCYIKSDRAVFDYEF
jgi:hypothetical protein